MEVKVGEYVRTKEGYIAKITEIDHHIWFDSIVYKESGIPKYELSKEEFSNLVIKHSPNILDLIEVGDYVNGNKVLVNIGKFLEVSSCDIGNNRIFNYMIKTIVTKEMYSNAEYRVETNQKL